MDPHPLAPQPQYLLQNVFSLCISNRVWPIERGQQNVIFCQETVRWLYWSEENLLELNVLLDKTKTSSYQFAHLALIEPTREVLVPTLQFLSLAVVGFVRSGLKEEGREEGKGSTAAAAAFLALSKSY